MPAAFCGLSFRDPSTCDGNSGALASSDPVDIKPVVHNFVCSLFRTAVSTANIVNIKYISDYCYLASQQCPVSRITLCLQLIKKKQKIPGVLKLVQLNALQNFWVCLTRNSKINLHVCGRLLST